ncbi:hypothetical protein ACFQZ4_05175 [Catellatospora coxensis]
MRIAARGLLAQHSVRTDRATGRHTTTRMVEGDVATARRRTTRTPQQPTGRRPKTGPTPKRPTVSKLSRRVPDRRTVPAPPNGGQRPAGQEPKSHHRPAVAASGPVRDLLKRNHHRTGFHHVNATPVIWLPADFGPGTTRPRPTRNV